MGKSVKTAIMIQARMGASRLPGKVLMDIEGHPMISHVVERCHAVPSADSVTVLTTTEPQDDPLAKYLKEANIDFFRGSERDVLDRYFQCAELRKIDVIVRITADCPLIDPGITDKAILFFLKKQTTLDYVNNFFKRTFPRGLDTEIFSMKALKRAWHEAKKPHEREHVTPYFYEQEGRFYTDFISSDVDYSHMRWTVDEPKDLEFVRAVYRRLFKSGKLFSWKETLALLDHDPALTLINKDVHQKIAHAV